MSKLLTINTCLAFALALGGVAQAGGHGGSFPSPQGYAPSPQGYAAPSAQSISPSPQGYAETCAPAKHCGFKMPKLCLPKISMPKICLPKPAPKCYEYEWVLKKKRCGGGLLGKCFSHGAADCGNGGGVYATEQYASPQAYGSGQAYPTAQYTGDVYGASQAYGAGQSYGSGQAYGAGQMGAPGMMEPTPTPEVEGDEVPEAPVVPSAYGRLGSSLFGTSR